jgi:hypothetical protein
MHTKFLSENSKVRDFLEDVGRRWEDNIRMDLREIGWEGMNWMHLAQDREQWRAVVNTVMNLRVPLKAGLSDC